MLSLPVNEFGVYLHNHILLDRRAFRAIYFAAVFITKLEHVL